VAKKIHCDADGLKLAIEDTLKQMKDDGADGFDYEIGTIEGMKLRIVAEPENAGEYETLVMEGGFNFTAVVEVYP
jgi:hypothetical protein